VWMGFGVSVGCPVEVQMRLTDCGVSVRCADPRSQGLGSCGGVHPPSFPICGHAEEQLSSQDLQVSDLHPLRPVLVWVQHSQVGLGRSMHLCQSI
jgi:hypothetical protein